MAAHALRDKTVLVDCRWLGVGGPGRATTLLLRGLQESDPPGRWVLWGPPAARAFLWGKAEWYASGSFPMRLWGQGAVLRAPASDVAIYMHQVRPLRPGRSVTLIHDTIPLRYGAPVAVRLLKRGFLATVARLSSRILTVSQHSKRCIERDLRVPPSRIRVVRFPADQEMAARVRVLKQELPQRDVAIYVGRFAAHKNLHALIAAFEATRFRQRGGRLLLVGGSPREVAELRGFIGRRRLEWATVKGSCPQSELEELFATSRLLVMPSLEEGFGLPVWEAMTCGLPVCVSDGGALPETSRSIARPFPARSVSAMTAAIDDVADQPEGTTPQVQGPTLTEFVAAFVEEAEAVVSRPT